MLFKIDVPIYENVVYFANYTEISDKDKLRKILKGVYKKNYKEYVLDDIYDSLGKGNIEDFNFSGLTIKNGCLILVVFRDLKDTPQDKNTIAHEIFHIAEMILASKGMTLTRESSEAYAYLIGYITEQFYKNYI